MNTNNINLVWLRGLNKLLNDGLVTAPRGQRTTELPQVTYVIDMRAPVLTVRERKLNYRFMANEASWIIHGDNRVSSIAGTNSKIAEFSDDGETFFGAYGPKWVSQRDYVVKKLVADGSTRQAGVTLWRENPPETKDVPCTIALFFQLRDGLLNCHAFMRSSDIWLGLPYDMFNFSMLAHEVCALINTAACLASSQHVDGTASVAPGLLYLTAASSHLYDAHRRKAEELVSSTLLHTVPAPVNTPIELYTSTIRLRAALAEIIAGPVDSPSRWWAR